MKAATTSFIEYYTHTSLPDRVIADWVAHDNRILAEEVPEDPPVLVEDVIRRMRSIPSTDRRHFWLLRHGRRIVAVAILGWAELESNRKSAFVRVGVDRHLRRRGFGTRLLALALARSRKAMRPLLFAHSSDRFPAGVAFLRRFGFRQALEIHINQLTVDRLDRALMASWLSTGSERAAGYAVELWDGPVPEQWLAPFADLYSVMNTIPRGELELEDTVVTPRMIREGETFLFANGSRRLTACARHVASGALVGFTELIWNPKRATIVWQQNTGVVVEHRNQGLGRWLKAANMDAMLQANPAARFVRTGNADSNAPMLAINRQMGFVPFIAEIAWQGSAPAIAQRLPRAPVRTQPAVPGRRAVSTKEKGRTTPARGRPASF
jgi:GNAT superfamily N-acetyltransferase